jgi:hypothetical protein
MCRAPGETGLRFRRLKGPTASHDSDPLWRQRVEEEGVEQRGEHEESHMMPETQVYTIARQMFERHGLEAIAYAARNALASEKKGDADEAQEWRHIEDAIKMMRGPHQS